MQVSDKLIRPLTEAKYLNADNVSRYRCIMRIFFEHYAFMKDELEKHPEVYYAGDLDPEGILIAQKLSRYYKGEFHYWHMETEDYEKCKSEEVISPKRMKILERITDDRLKPVVERIKAYGTAGYQEMLMEETK